MKHVKYLFTALLLLCSTIASAHDFQVDGIYYNITDATAKTVEVTYCGDDPNYYNEYIGSVVIPSMVTYKNVAYSVTSIGEWAFYYCRVLTSITIPNSVTTIGDRAFDDCTGLTSITIPNSVTSIGYYAFYGCIGLEEVHISDLAAWCKIYFESYYSSPFIFFAPSLYLDGEKVTNLVIPDGVTTIKNYAFCDCDGLTSITIPNSVKSIGSSAFRGCSGLTSVTIPASVTSIGDNAFYDCTRLKEVINYSYLTFTKGSTGYGYVAYYADKVINEPGGSLEGDFVFAVVNGVNTLIQYLGIGGAIALPDSYKGEGYMIGSDVFKNNTTITSVTIPNSVTSIGSYAFYYCTSLTSVTIPNCVTSIGSSAFSGCSSLKSITIPNSVTSIGSSAFSNCSSLKSITIPNSVTSIGSSAFYNCSSLASITIPSSVTSIGRSAFNGCTALKELRIEDGAETLSLGYNVYNSNSTGKGLFYDCPLETLYLDRNLSYNTSWNYGYSPFYNIKTLTSVAIGDNVTSIGSNAFSGCSSLKSITIPNSVTSIGSSAFYYCTSLTSVTIPNCVTSIGSSAFSGCSSLKTVINHSNLTLTKGSSDYGYVAYYADKVINAPNGSIEGDFVFTIIDGVNTLCGYLGNETSIVLPQNYKGENYAIGNSVFKDCTSLTSVTIGNSVTTIGYDAFLGCSSLKEVHITDLVAWCNIDFSDYDSNPLYYAKNLYLNGVLVTNLVIPDGVTEIKKYAFYDCSLTSITIPNSVTSIGDGAFKYCNSLKSITIPNSVTSIGSSAFYYCTSLKSVTIPNSVTSIGSSAFSVCSSLKTVINFSNLTLTKGSSDYGYVAYYADKVINAPNGSIEGDFVFSIIDGVNTLCEYLGNDISIVLPSNYKGESYVIGEDAFRNCTSLTNVTIPNSVTTIGSSAFYGCSGLTSVTIPNSVTTIRYDAFYKCSSLKEVHITDLVAWCNIDFSDSNPLYYAKNLYLNGELVTNLVIPDWVTEIKKYAFYYCSSLTSVTIPNSVTTIRYDAFYKCSSLTSVTIPNSVTTIGNYAFYSCSNLKEIYCKAETPATIAYYTFYNCYSATLYVPRGAKDAYQSAEYWSNFANIVEMDFAITGDINGDDKVDVGDVTILIGMILDASLLTDSGDINGDNKVDVGDVTTLVAIILGTNNTPARAAAMEEYNVELSVEGDEQSLTIDATATDYPYSAVQFDVYLPAGVKAIGNMVVGCGNAAAYKEQADGAVRVVIYSPSNTAIANKSASIAIDATGLALGSHPVEVKNIIFSAPGRAKIVAWDSEGSITIAGTTGIDGVVSEAGDADAVVYDLQGHRVTEIVKGRVYIKNGSKFIAQ